MVTPFSQRVAAPDWFEQAAAWIVTQVNQRGDRVIGDIEQRRIRPWSTQLVVPTDAGQLWFKASCRSMSFEPALHEALAELVPQAVDRPYAVDIERGWLLTTDRGPTLHEQREPTAKDWQRVVEQTAVVQEALSCHGDRLLATGLPHCSPSTTLDRFDRLVGIYQALPAQHPAHVPPELQGRLQGARPRLVEAVQRLAASALPVTWQHGDLHPGNTFSVGEDMRLFDFGDSQWAHALEVLAVPYGCTTSLSQVPWTPLLAAYAHRWGVDHRTLDEDWSASRLTQAVNRSLTWWSCLEEATAQEWLEWGDLPVAHLSRMLDP